jgi:hypothetical protein
MSDNVKYESTTFLAPQRSNFPAPNVAEDNKLY